MNAHRDETLVDQAACMALARRHPEPGLLHHSDRGSQYTAADYRELLTSYGIVVSMSGKGDCYDNALMESFFGTLKSECVDRQSFQSRAQAPKRSLSTWRRFTIDSDFIPRWVMSVLSPMSNKRSTFPRLLTPQKRVKDNAIIIHL